MRSLRAFLVATLVLAGCEGMPQRVLTEEQATAAQGYGRAFGRVEYTEDGKPLEPNNSFFSAEELTLFVRAAPDGAMQFMDVQGDGRFVWPLRPGAYDLVGFQLERRSYGVRRIAGRIMARFEVGPAGQATYVGTLRIRGASRGYRLEVADDFEDAKGGLPPGLAAPKVELVRAAMQLEKREPGKVRSTTGICSPAWGIECDRTYQGVVPVRPEGGGSGFPLMGDRRPLLEWKPSSRDGVTYDVAIYESLSFMFGLNGRVDRLRGRLVAYAEGLAQPQYMPAEPLPAGTRLEWTVRLRRGEAVSTWSSMSYDRFYLVAAAWGSGLGFGFETPK